MSLLWTQRKGIDLGLLPVFFQENDPRPAHEQLHERYAHGGGFNEFGTGVWELELDRANPINSMLSYPDDPEFPALAFARLRDELILFFMGSWICFVQPDGTFKVARVD